MTIKFYRVGEPYGCFSNFSAHPVKIGRRWPTSEHYFQAQKFKNKKVQDLICRDPNPMRAARIGRDRQYKLRADWNEVKDDVMRAALRAKFTQHNDLRELLLATGDQEIIEHTENDSYWADGGDGSGKNMLGKLLMELRADLAAATM